MQERQKRRHERRTRQDEIVWSPIKKKRSDKGRVNQISLKRTWGTYATRACAQPNVQTEVRAKEERVKTTGREDRKNVKEKRETVGEGAMRKEPEPMSSRTS